MSKESMADEIRSDPRFLYAYSPRNTAADTRYKFIAGEKSEERSIRTLQAAYQWMVENPPTDRDWARVVNDPGSRHYRAGRFD